MTSGHKSKMRKLDEYIDVYLYGEQEEDHHRELDLMSKQLVESLRLGGVGVKCRPE